jgi:hypothetical protein
MLYLKKGVIINEKTHPMMFVAMFIVDTVLSTNYGIKECWITSGLDGKHGDDSLHPEGKALDFRTRNWPMGKKKNIVTEIKKALGSDFDVVFESEGKPQEHAHIEYDPK